MLLVCDEMGLIGREMFAVDGVKMPSNASKEWSGTREEFQKKAEKLERALGYLTKRHREADAAEREGQIEQAREKQMRTLNRALAKVRGWLETGTDRLGVSGKAVKSNITDPESAKMKTSKGVIQGYDGMAVVDAKHQIVVHSEAYGQGQEHNLLVPVLEGVRESFKALGRDEDILQGMRVSADAGLHSEANLQYLQDNQIDGYVADTNFRKRESRALPVRSTTGCGTRRTSASRTRRRVSTRAATPIRTSTWPRMPAAANARRARPCTATASAPTPGPTRWSGSGARHARLRTV